MAGREEEEFGGLYECSENKEIMKIRNGGVERGYRRSVDTPDIGKGNEGDGRRIEGGRGREREKEKLL